jgi:hypothetical protein
VTVRDWLDAKHYLHDLAATDKRQPTVNAFGPMYGSTELSTNEMPILDPVHNTKATVTMPVRDPEDVPSSAQANAVFAPSPYWGNEQVWDSQSNAHTPGDGPAGPDLFRRADTLVEGSARLLRRQFTTALGAAFPADAEAGCVCPERAAGDRL